MEFDNGFEVAAPIDEVWRAMLDVERVAPCVPGARVVEKTGEDAYKVAIKVRLGPVSMTYNGNVEVVEADAAARRAVMSAKAKEARGQGTANATVEMRLAETDGVTRGTIHSDVALSGRAAAMGQGVIGDVSAKLIETFAANLATMLSGAPAAEEAAVAAEEAAVAAEEAAVAAGAAPPPAAAAGTATEAAAAPAPAPAEAAPAAIAAAPAAGAPTEPPGAKAGERAAAARPAAAPRPAPAVAADEGLPIGSILGSVARDRLQDPRALGGLLAVVALVAFLLGRRSAR